jgi:chromosome partitioning protein
MILSVVNHKGGTGKTTTVVNLAAALVALRKKVLVIDFDPQGNLSYSMGIDANVVGISEVIQGSKQVEEVDIELTLQSVENRVFVLKNTLKNIKNTYDFVLIDCPPSRSLLTINALAASDSVISTVLLDVLSMQGLNQIHKTIVDVTQHFNPNLRILGVVAVQYDSRKKIAQEVLQFMKESFDLPLFDTFIRNNVKVCEAPSHGKSVLKYAPTSNGALDYLKLANELFTRI